jgi:hypothetical protein
MTITAMGSRDRRRLRLPSLAAGATVGVIQFDARGNDKCLQ